MGQKDQQRIPGRSAVGAQREGRGIVDSGCECLGRGHRLGGPRLQYVVPVGMAIDRRPRFRLTRAALLDKGNASVSPRQYEIGVPF